MQLHNKDHFIFLSQNVPTIFWHFAVTALVVQCQKLYIGVHCLFPVNPHIYKQIVHIHSRVYSQHRLKNCQEMTIYTQMLHTKQWGTVSSFLCICGGLCKFNFSSLFSLEIISPSQILQNLCPFISCSHSHGYTDTLPTPYLWQVKIYLSNIPFDLRPSWRLFFFIFHGSWIVHKTTTVFLLLLLIHYLIPGGQHLSALTLLLIQHTCATSGFWSSSIVPAYILWW